MNSKDEPKNWLSIASEAKSILDSLTDKEYHFLINSQLPYKEKILLFDILTLFNNVEMNLNRILNLKYDIGALLSNILNDQTNPKYNSLFNTEVAENFRKILKENIEIRHLIAHGVPKKYKDIECIIFLTSNKKDWDKKIVKSPEGKCNIRQMRKNHIITPIVSISSLKALRATLIDIDSYFAFHTAKETLPT